MTGEITYDLVMEADMSFVEGCYRLPNGDWQVIIVSKTEVTEPLAEFTEWDSGVKGIYLQVPRTTTLTAALMERLLSEILYVEKWTVVRGPDSMNLR